MKALKIFLTIKAIIIICLLLLQFSCSLPKNVTHESLSMRQFSLNTNGITLLAYDENGQLMTNPGKTYNLEVQEKSLTKVKDVIVSLKTPTLLNCSYLELQFNSNLEHPQELVCGTAMLQSAALSYLGSPRNGIIIAAQVIPEGKKALCHGELLRVRFQSGAQLDRPLSTFKQDPTADPIIANATVDGSEPNKIVWTFKLRGEGNQNQIFDFADFGSVGANYNKSVSTTPACEPCDGNVNGKVDFADFGVIGAEYNKGIGGFNVYRDDNASPSNKLGVLSTSGKIKGDFSLANDANKVTENGFKQYWHTFGGSGRYIKLELIDIKGQPISGHTVTIDTAGGGLQPQWAMVGRDKAGTRRTDAFGPSYPKIKWEYTSISSDSIYGAVAIAANSTVYFGSLNKKFYSLKPDGTLNWEYTDSTAEIEGSPAIDAQGNIYFGSIDKNLYALKPDKTLLWKFETGNEIISSPIIGDDGTIYDASSDAKLYAVGPDGKAKWSYEFTDGTDKFIGSTPAIGPDGTIYSAAEDQKLYAFNPKDGSVKWKSEADILLDIKSSPVVGSDGTIYLASVDGNLIAINPDNGKTKWTFNDTEKVAIFMAPPAIMANGNIVVGSLNKRLYCVKPDGKLDWFFNASDKINNSALIDGKGAIYFATEDKLLYKLNSKGEKDWQIAFKDICIAPPVMANGGTIYIGCLNGSMYAITNDPNPPQVYPPTNLQATNGDYEDKIVLTWLAPTKGLTPEGYKIYRYEPETDIYKNIATLGNVLTYEDKAVVKDKTYWYYVSSIYADKESIGSEIASGYLKTGPAGRSEWWMFGGEPTHQHRSKYAGPASDTIKKSEFYDLGDKINVSPVVGSDGVIYAASNKVYAIRPDKSVKWIYEPYPGDPDKGFLSGSPALAEDGTLYIGATEWQGDGAIIALDPNGKALWQYNNGGSMSSPAIGKDGNIYVGGDYLYAFKPSKGPTNDPIWIFKQAESRFSSSPAIGEVDSEEVIYIGCNDSYLYAINAKDGTERWKIKTANEIYSSPAIGADGTIYVAHRKGVLYAVNKDGKQKWTRQVSNYWSVYSSPAIMTDGTIILCCSQGYVWAINPDDGVIKWSCFVGTKISDTSYKGISYSCPTIDKDNFIYVGTDGGYICCVSPIGTQVWKDKIVDDSDIEDCKSSAVIVSNGTLYIGADAGILYAITK